MNTNAATPLSRPATRRPTAIDVRTVPPSDHDLTVIIPAYNEEKRLPWTLSELGKTLDHWDVDYRVLVADDGSTDCTAVLTRDLGPRFSTIRVSPQGGKGRAVRIAMLQATGRVLAFTDADLPFRLTAMRQGFDWIRDGRCDVVFGARDIAGAENLAPRRLLRRLATFTFREFVRRLVSHEITDTQCGLKLFKRRAALELFSRTTIDGFAFDAELVFWTHQLNLNYRRVPVTLVNEFSSTLSLRRNALPMLMDVVRLRLRHTAGRVAPAPHFMIAGEASQNERQQAAA
jgi:dolichyl-phosphate beta-glucosyltransferase